MSESSFGVDVRRYNYVCSLLGRGWDDGRGG